MRVRKVAVYVSAMWMAATLGACGEAGRSTGPSNPSAPPASAIETASVIVGMAGEGQIGDGQPMADGVNLQTFELDAGLQLGQVGGRLDYVDYSVVKPDGNYAHLRAGSEEPGTAVTEFLQISATCVEISGVGRLLNTGELLEFVIQACDNGTPGAGRDVFGLWVHQRVITHGGTYQRGPDMLSGGELTRTATL